ncbi:MAG: hypothetical protein ACRCX8_06685 [Sarcina sp.]
MGYCISVNEENFSFKIENAENILEAIKEGITTQKITEERWIDFNTLLHARTIEEVFDELRFDTKVEDDKCTIEFYGEKFGGYEESVFKCIAPYVEDGYLEYIGEDGDRWRYIFKGGKCREVYPKLIWE